jgi:hypothetical protein
MVLCLLGFRGEGYSTDFVEQLHRVHVDLADHPGQFLELTTSPDAICGACPNLAEAGCTLGGPDHEAHMRAQDEDVLARLGLAAGTAISWTDLRALISTRIRGQDLVAICTTCPWLELGYCAEGVDALLPTPSHGGPHL